MDDVELPEPVRPDLVCGECGHEAIWYDSDAPWVADDGEPYCPDHPNAPLVARPPN